MALEVTDWDLADNLSSPEDIYYHLQVEFEDYEPLVMPCVLDAAMRARGGAAAISDETGIPASSFKNLSTMDDASIRDLALRLMEAYRPAVSSTKVA